MKISKKIYYKRANTAGVSPQMKRIMKTGGAEKNIGTFFRAASQTRNKHSGCKSAVVYFSLIILSLTAGSVSGAGKTGAEFLKFGTGARPMGMGGAFAAAADSTDAVWWNPGGLSLLKFKELSFMHNEAGEGIRHAYLCYAQPSKKLRGSIGLSITYFSVNDIQGYSSGGVATEEIEASDTAAALAYSRMLLPNFSAGISVKYLMEKLHNKEASALTTTIGALWKSPFEGLKLGAALQNFGGALKFISDEDPLPGNLKFGAAYSARIFGTPLLIATDVNIPYDCTAYINSGAEAVFFNTVAVRAGYKSKDDLANGLRLGGGLKNNNLQIDYAWMPRGYFNDSHRFSVAVRFGNLFRESSIEADIREHLIRGENYFHSGRLINAYREFREILLVAPRHKKARDYMTRIELSIEEVESKKEISNALAKGREMLEKGDLTGATEVFETVLALDPDNEKALESLREIRKRFDEVSRSILADAVKLYQQAEYEKAKKEINRVLVLEPDNKEALKYSALVSEKLKEFARIREELLRKQQQRLRERKIASNMEKANQRFQKEDWDGSINLYKTVLLLDSNNKTAAERISEAYYYKAKTLEQRGNYIEAKENLQKSVKYNSNNSKAKEQLASLNQVMDSKSRELNTLGLKEYSAGNFDKAIKLWQKALRFNEKNIKALGNLKRVRKEMEKK